MELRLAVRSQVTDRLLGKHVKAARVGEGGDLGQVGRGDRLVLRSHHRRCVRLRLARGRLRRVPDVGVSLRSRPEGGVPIHLGRRGWRQREMAGAGHGASS